MVDLLQSQIQESCKLALPEGLKDLMCDISREVLRAKPTNLFNFIADYLSALLVTRENLSIASRVCADVYDCGCQPELKEELRNIGLYDEEIPVVTEIILEHFYKGEVDEAKIIMKILKCIDIDEDQLLDVQEAIRNAFIQHQANHTTIYESSSESDKDEIDNAVRHTLKVYRKTKPTDAEYEAMARKIQASYRAYGVKRWCQLKPREKKEQTRVIEKNFKLVLPGDVPGSSSEMTVHEDEEIPHRDRHVSSSSFPITISSTSLAGSYMNLPRYVPYSAHNIEEPLSELKEFPEKEYAHINYTAENPHFSISYDKPVHRERKISFEDDIVSDEESITEVIKYEEIHEEIGEVLENERIDEEEIVASDQESVEYNDENVVAIDLDVKNNGIEAVTDDKSLKPDDNDQSLKDGDIVHGNENILGSAHEIIDDEMAEFVMHQDLSPEYMDKDGSEDERDL